MPALRPALKRILVGIFAAVFLWGYFSRLPIPGFLGMGVALLLAAFTALAAFGFGAWPLAALWNEGITLEESVVFAMALGWGMLAMGTALLGVLHAWVPLGGRLLITVGAALGVYSVSNILGPSLRIAGATAHAWRRWLWLIIPIGIASLLMAFAPPTYYDALVYHLALPSAYLHAGHWLGWPELVYSAFPQNLEMLWTLGLLTGIPVMPNLIGWMLALTLILAVDLWCRRFADAETGAVAVVFLLLMPALLLLSAGGYVDIGLTLFGFLSVYALCLAMNHPRPQGLFVLAGLLAGLAVGVKYTGGISAAIGLLWILVARRTDRVPAATRYGIAALLAFAPWLIKNTIVLGNPVFPFFYAFGSQAHSPWMKDAAQGYFRNLVEYHPHSLIELPRLLWSIAVEGMRFGGGIDILGDFGWAPLVLFLPCLALASRRPAPLKALGGYAALFFTVWGLTRPVLRFLLPIAPLLAILSAYGWVHGLERGGRALRGVGYVALALLGLSNASLFFQITDVTQPFRVPLAMETRGDYLKAKLNYYGAAAFINENTDPRTTVLIVGDQRSYYYQRRVAAWTVFNRNPLVDWADHAADASALRAELHRHADVMVVNRAEMERLAPYGALAFSARGQKTWDAVLRDTPAIYRDAACAVYAL